MAERVAPLKLVSLLLGYPSEVLREAAGAAGEVEIAPASGRQAERLYELCAWYAATPVGRLQRRYVESFDFSKQCSLHLTYHVHGDHRQRGMACCDSSRPIRQAGSSRRGRSTFTCR